MERTCRDIYCEILQKWKRIKKLLGTYKEGVEIAALLSKCWPEGFDVESTFTLYLSTPSLSHHEKLSTPECTELILRAIRDSTGNDVVGRIVFNQPGCVEAHGSEKSPIEEAVEVLESLDF